MFTLRNIAVAGLLTFLLLWGLSLNKKSHMSAQLEPATQPAPGPGPTTQPRLAGSPQPGTHPSVSQASPPPPIHPASPPLQAPPVAAAPMPSSSGPPPVVWKGWGTSLAWWTYAAAELPSEQQQQLYDILFDNKTGLGLNIVRYLIPGGKNDSLSPQMQWNPERSVPGFWMDPDEPYDWTADERQRNSLLEAIRRGVDTTEAITFSPPWWMTISGDVAGNEDGKPNVQKDMYSTYAEYLAEVIHHYKTEWNVTFETFAPFNEPKHKWWKKGNGQEGNTFKDNQVLPFLRRVRAALDDKGLTEIKLSVIDDWPLSTMEFLEQVQESPEDWALVSRVDVHGYKSPTVVHPHERRFSPSYYTGVRDAAAALGLPIRQSEWGPLSLFPSRSSDLSIALLLARSISEHVNFMGAEAWSHWQAVTPCYGPCNDTYTQHWGLVRLPQPLNVPQDFFFSKQFFVFQHFSRWIRPGAEIVRVDDAHWGRFTCQAVDVVSRRFIAVLTNQEDFTVRQRVEVPGSFCAMAVGRWGGGSLRLSKYRTGAEDDVKEYDNQTLSDCPDSLNLRVPAATIVTVVLEVLSSGSEQPQVKVGASLKM